MIPSKGLLQALDLVVQRQRWQLDVHRHASVRAQRQFEDALAEREQTRTLHQAMLRGQASRPHTAALLDPQRKQAHLEHLCLLAGHLARQSTRCETLRRACDEQRQRCAQAQLRLQSMEDHRERCRATVAQTQRRLQATLADQDWQLLQQWSGRSRCGV